MGIAWFYDPNKKNAFYDPARRRKKFTFPKITGKQATDIYYNLMVAKGRARRKWEVLLHIHMRLHRTTHDKVMQEITDLFKISRQRVVTIVNDWRKEHAV